MASTQLERALKSASQRQPTHCLQAYSRLNEGGPARDDSQLMLNMRSLVFWAVRIEKHMQKTHMQKTHADMLMHMHMHMHMHTHASTCTCHAHACREKRILEGCPYRVSVCNFKTQRLEEPRTRAVHTAVDSYFTLQPIGFYTAHGHTAHAIH